MASWDMGLAKPTAPLWRLWPSQGCKVNHITFGRTNFPPTCMHARGGTPTGECD